MKIIALEEHYTLPAMAEANPNSPRKVFEAMWNEGFGDADPQGGWQWPAGVADPSWSLSFNAYLGMVNLIGIDRIVFTADYPFANMKACRQFFEQMPINPADKEKIAHINAERLLGLSNNAQPQQGRAGR
jgi:hypothetical protein